MRDLARRSAATGTYTGEQLTACEQEGLTLMAEGLGDAATGERLVRASTR